MHNDNPLFASNDMQLGPRLLMAEPPRSHLVEKPAPPPDPRRAGIPLPPDHPQALRAAIWELTQRVERLERQTVRAYWIRFLTWIGVR